MVKKIAVIGSTGMLGYAVSEYFFAQGWDVQRIDRQDYDIAEDPVSKLEPLLNGSQCVVNCAGVIKPRIAVNSVENVVRINAIFPRNLAELCRRRKMMCFHITTDCVYSGRKGQYTEHDLFDAEDLYGMTKNAGETANCMTLRTSIIGEEKGQSRSLLEWARSQAGQEIKGFINHSWNGVTTLYLAEIIALILEWDLYRPGIFHIHSPDSVSKYELMQIFNEVYGLQLQITPHEADLSVDRSLASIFTLSKDLASKPIRQQVREMRTFWRLKENQASVATRRKGAKIVEQVSGTKTYVYQGC